MNVKATGPKRETMREAGYEYVAYLGNGEHSLRDKATGNVEVWFSNKNHASYGIIFKNTHLEFARSV